MSKTIECECGGYVGFISGGAFNRAIGGQMIEGPAWCPKCGKRFWVERCVENRIQTVRVIPLKVQVKVS